MAQVALVDPGRRLSCHRLRHHREVLHGVAGRLAMTFDTGNRTRRRMPKIRHRPRTDPVALLAARAESPLMPVLPLVTGGAVQHGATLPCVGRQAQIRRQRQQRGVLHRCWHPRPALMLRMAGAAGGCVGMKGRGQAGQQRRFVMVTGAACGATHGRQWLMAVSAGGCDSGMRLRQRARADEGGQRLVRP